jgi:alpha-glucosidase (family GH31 glycosyl hydrolase)
LYLGVDFWWLDWQQWEYTDIPNLNPTYMLNYVFTTNNARRGSLIRPTILHRWGGLGNHKFQLGFSGDVYPSWESLAFQPYFTQTAANVGFMWSHDIGGHNTPVEPELYTRWVQWGAFSPVFRTHCTKQANNDRRIWVFPFENFQIMRDAIQLRLDLIPYIYTAAYETTQTGLAFVYPMYYDYPESTEAYTFPNQYMFGSSMIVAPIVTPVDPVTALAETTVWLPPATSWVEMGSGRLLSGGQTVTRYYTLSEIPVFVASGSIFPMLSTGRKNLGAAQEQYNGLRWRVYVGDALTGQYTLYEDDPDITTQRSASMQTTVSYGFLNGNFIFGIGAASGTTYNSFPSTRTLEFEIVGVPPAQSVTFNSMTGS